jgi:predicted ester cyclase
VSTENKDLVRAYHERLWRDGDVSAIGELWSPDAAVHMTGFDGTAVDVVHEDVTRNVGAFTEVETAILDLLGDGDRVVLRWETSGRHVGPYGDIAATGKRITMRGIDILRVADGRIVECWSMWDGLDVYGQLGALPEGLA